MGSFVWLSCLLTELQSLECKKWLIFLVFCCWQQKINHSFGIKCYISFLHFKTFKIQHVGVSPLYHVLVCKIHVYVPNMKISCLLPYVSFFIFKLVQIPNKLTNLICWMKYTQKRYFRSKIEKVNMTIEFHLLELVQVPKFSIN